MKRAFFVGLILFLIIGTDLLFPITHHEGATWQHWPGAYGFFGFLICLLLILVAKALGKAFLLQTKRPKGNYIDE